MIWIDRSLIFVVAGLLLGLVGCQKEPQPKAGAPVTLTRAAVSVDDGMILLDYPGPKSQMLKRDGTVDYFCDTVGLLNALHDPLRAHAISRAFVQPFDGRKWGSYADGWMEASESVYVIGSRRMGAMGPTLVPFREAGNAQAFAAANGGRILTFAEITAKVMDDHARMVQTKLRGQEGYAARMGHGHGAAPMKAHKSQPEMGPGRNHALRN